jgi:hypothetical protein
MHPTDLTANISQVDNIIVSPSEFISHAQVLAENIGIIIKYAAKSS